MVALEPTLPSDAVSRTMLLHEELQALLGDSSSIDRIGQLKADLEAFTRGKEISVSPSPYKHRTAYLGLLAPEQEGTWEVRSRRPGPGIRVFGRFPYQDTFVALTWGLRSRGDQRWPDKIPLGDRNSMQYQFCQISVDQRWKRLFPFHSPISGNTVSDLLSGKYNVL